MSSHDDTGAARTRLYQFFIKMSYLAEETMEWPPQAAQALNLELCRSVGLGENATALLQKIPWTTENVRLTTKTWVLNYSEEETVAGRRHAVEPYDEANHEEHNKVPPD